MATQRNNSHEPFGAYPPPITDSAKAKRFGNATSNTIPYSITLPATLMDSLLIQFTLKDLLLIAQHREIWPIGNQ
jgi:hypothetical protein